jgi:hypothetical protein
MITPSKAVSIPDSALGQATAILERGPAPRDVSGLYRDVAARFASIDDFILALDLLYVLGRVDIQLPTHILTYAD